MAGGGWLMVVVGGWWVVVDGGVDAMGTMTNEAARQQWHVLQAESPRCSAVTVGGDAFDADRQRSEGHTMPGRHGQENPAECHRQRSCQSKHQTTNCGEQKPERQRLGGTDAVYDRAQHGREHNSYRSTEPK